MEDQLVLATWGLVVATLLLFLFAAGAIPAIAQFREWRERKNSLASAAATPRNTDANRQRSGHSAQPEGGCPDGGNCASLL